MTSNGDFVRFVPSLKRVCAVVVSSPSRSEYMPLAFHLWTNSEVTSALRLRAGYSDQSRHLLK